MTSLPTLLTTPLTTRAEAEAWIVKMYEVGYGAHPDDPGATLMNMQGTPVRTFTDAQAEQYDARMSEVFDLVPDPYAVGLDVLRRMQESYVSTDAVLIVGAWDGPEEDAAQIEADYPGLTVLVHDDLQDVHGFGECSVHGPRDVVLTALQGPWGYGEDDALALISNNE